METKDMVRMANQIASYFRAYPEEEAVKETAKHLKSFWEPRMRKLLDDHVAKGGEGLEPLVLKAHAKLH
ncbi:MAG: formate dehydrogenase subunit delta [Aestuariivirga sp.]